MINLISQSIRVGLLASVVIGLGGPLVVLGPALADDPKKIAWREDLGQAQAEAKSRDLLLWIQFTGPWCINLPADGSGDFRASSPWVNQSRDHFIPIKLRSDEHEALAQSLGTDQPSVHGHCPP